MCWGMSVTTWNKLVAEYGKSEASAITRTAASASYDGGYAAANKIVADALRAAEAAKAEAAAIVAAVAAAEAAAFVRAATAKMGEPLTARERETV